MRRDWSSYGSILLLLVVFGLGAWMTRQPEAPFFDRAVELPVVGSALSALRDRYLDGEQGSRAPAEPHSTREGESLWLGLGSVLRRQPDHGAAELERIERLRNYEIVERQSSWIAVRRPDGSVGWFDPAAIRDMTPPLGSEPDPVLPVAARPPSPARLEAARAVLGREVREAALGGYSLLTDVISDLTVQPLEAALVDVEDKYRKRYGLSLVSEPAETIVLFQNRNDYRRFSSEVEGLAEADSSGHTHHGIVALFVEGRTSEELRKTLLHEVAHLLNRRALGPALPPWLDEGLAQEFAFFSAGDFGSAGELGAADELGGPLPSYLQLKTVEGNQVLFFGALAGLEALRERFSAGTLISLESLVALDQPSFAHSPESADLYNQSAFWLHSMLRKRACRSPFIGFCAFLQGVASGAPAGQGALLEALGMAWDEVENEFAAFVAEETARAGLTPPEASTDTPI